MWRVADGPNRAARSPSLRASTCCPSAQQGHACRITNFVWTFDSLNVYMRARRREARVQDVLRHDEERKERLR